MVDLKLVAYDPVIHIMKKEVPMFITLWQSNKEQFRDVGIP